MSEEDVAAVAAVHAAAFPRQLNSVEWVSCNLATYPRIQCFVAVKDGNIVGFIQWIQKSGFREKVVLELEQIAVAPSFRDTGIGRALITRSLPMVQSQLAERGAAITKIIVTTRSDNAAQKLYQSTLGAEVEATISNLYSADEVFLVTRNIPNA